MVSRIRQFFYTFEDLTSLVALNYLTRSVPFYRSLNTRGYDLQILVIKLDGEIFYEDKLIALLDYTFNRDQALHLMIHTDSSNPAAFILVALPEEFTMANSLNSIIASFKEIDIQLVKLQTALPTINR